MEDFSWLNKNSRAFLAKTYLAEGQSAEERIDVICQKAEEILNIPGFADRFKGYMAKGWYSLSTPVWANFGTQRALPISCFGSYISDTMQSILHKATEIGMMTKFGGGTSAYYGALRSRGSKFSTDGETSGPVHFIQLAQTVTSLVSQDSVRRGAFAAYLDVEHPDILEHLQIQEEGNPLQYINFAVCIPDKWMEEMIAGDKDKRKIWAKIIQRRFECGEPYLLFVDTANNNKPQVYKDKNMRIYASNVCNEIMLPSSEEESFVCDLSSMNLLHYDSWKETDAVETLLMFLDAVMTEFIDKTENLPEMKAAHNFAVNHRALGLGVMGWHSLLQSKNIAFESMEAKFLNVEIFKLIKRKTDKATEEMAELYGEAPLCIGYKRRNTTCMTIPPGTSSSFINEQGSSGIEPFNANYFIDDVAKGKFTFKNPWLKKVLKDLDKDTPEVWKSILLKGGSVQHLDFLTDHQKEVFKTFGEISQKEIVIQAAQRQKYIDQGQSLNLKIHPKTNKKDVSDLLIEGWRMKIKGFYYQRSTNKAQELGRSILSCSSCAS